MLEPLHGFRLEAPADALGSVLPLLGRLGAVPGAPALRGDAAVVAGEIPAAHVDDVRGRLPGRTHGEGFLEPEFARHAPVRGAVPTRDRPRPDPLDREDWLHQVVR